MTISKSSTLTFRIEPNLKKALRTAAAREHRSITNMVKILIRDYCIQNGINIQILDDNTDGETGMETEE